MPTRSPMPKRHEAALTAAAVSLLPAKGRSPRDIDTMLGVSQSAAEQAWYFWNKVGELRYIARYIANAVSMARLYVGRVSSDPTRPDPLPEDHPAQQQLHAFAGGVDGQADLLDRLALHLTIVGDSILAGPKEGTTGQVHPYDQWRVYSTSEMHSRNGEIFVRQVNTQEQPLPKNVLPFRIWRQHPRLWWEADSPVLSSFTVLREIDLLDQHVHASAVSRLIGAGLLLLPDEMTLPADDVELDGIEVDPVIDLFQKIAAIAIKNRESAAALVPIMLRAPAEAISAVKHLTFSTPFDEHVPELRTVALRRLALSMDIPPEVLLGTADSTSWSAWQTDESTLRMHIQPLVMLIANSLTQGWLRPTLKALPLSKAVQDDIPNLMVWFDLSQLRVRPNVTEEAQALYDRFEVDGDVLRLTNGMSNSDKPTSDELSKQILLHLVRNDPSLTPYAINALRDKGMIDLPEARDPVANPEGRPADPNVTDIVGPRSVPGERSLDKQTTSPGVPADLVDPNNNSVGG